MKALKLILTLVLVGLFAEISYSQENKVIYAKQNEECNLRAIINRSSDGSTYTLVAMNKNDKHVSVEVYDLENKVYVEKKLFTPESSRALQVKLSADRYNRGKYLIRVNNGCKVVDNIWINE